MRAPAARSKLGIEAGAGAMTFSEATFSDTMNLGGEDVRRDTDATALPCGSIPENSWTCKPQGVVIPHCGANGVSRFRDVSSRRRINRFAPHRVIPVAPLKRSP